jgi:hypothetical protein
MSTQNESNSGSESQQGKQQTSSKRYVFTPWNSNQDHEMCVYAFNEPPERVPSLGRTGLATAKWVQVDRNDTGILICNRLHEGDCEWPYQVGSA